MTSLIGFPLFQLQCDYCTAKESCKITGLYFTLLKEEPDHAHLHSGAPQMLKARGPLGRPRGAHCAAQQKLRFKQETQKAKSEF